MGRMTSILLGAGSYDWYSLLLLLNSANEFFVSTVIMKLCRSLQVSGALIENYTSWHQKDTL